ncbi:MAG: hypothetical protein EA427_12595 [Spirochaetaceae bacterium]|nr:MAG: hypothetical protein EA427_12595 [Spirochaetaceae bacterium]
MSFSLRRVLVITGAAALLLTALLLSVFLISRRPGVSDPVREPAAERAGQPPAGDAPSREEEAQRGDTGAVSRPGATLQPVQDETVRRGLRFRDHRRDPVARLTLDELVVEDALHETSSRESRIITDLLGAPGEDGTDPFLQHVAPEARSYLPGELRVQLPDAGDVRAIFLVEGEMDGAVPEALQYVLFLREEALLVILYLEDGLVADGEVVPREWSSRRSLASGASGAPIHYP